jgi:hypothetical protein
MIAYESYGDIWGESTPPPSPKPKEWKAVGNLQDCSTNVLLPDEEHSELLMPEALTPAASGTEEKPVRRRWAAEPQEGEETDDDEDFEGEKEVVVKLAENKEEARPRMKRRGSNDLMPVVPSRRNSVFGAAKRQPSFQYKDLSQKGTSIEMKKASEGEETVTINDKKEEKN